MDEALQRVMSYENPAVVARLAVKLDVSTGKAEEIFDDTKKFLFLSTVTDKPISPSPVIDIGWHEFILFTRDYEEFCRETLGRFVHHVPNTGDSPTEAVPAREVAAHVFGQLSENWQPHKADCSPDTGGGGDRCSPEPSCSGDPWPT